MSEVSGEHKRRVYEHGMRAQLKLANEDRKRIKDTIDAKDDWKGRCSVCRVELKGTVAEITSHQCEVDDEHQSGQ